MGLLGVHNHMSQYFIMNFFLYLYKWDIYMEIYIYGDIYMEIYMYVERYIYVYPIGLVSLESSTTLRHQ